MACAELLKILIVMNGQICAETVPDLHEKSWHPNGRRPVQDA
jgi:hypothetical protein